MNPDLERIDTYLEKVERSERETGIPQNDRLKVGVDLGTAYIVLVVLDDQNNPVACEKQAAQVLRDGVVVDYTKALQIVRELKEKLETRISHTLQNCAIAMPADTESSIKTHQYVAEGAGFEVTDVLDEPTAANAVYGIRDGAVADIGGGTTGIAVFRDGKVIHVHDEPTGGTHVSLVLAGHYHMTFDEAERFKQDDRNHEEVLSVVHPVLEKMGVIIRRGAGMYHPDAVYLCGGTCCLTGIEHVIERETGILTVKPKHPFLVTPAGIAMNCRL
ncbi:ethanolamine utilization protein EutJ [Ruminococcus gauvreauii]|uniref:Ethanolamine utilization protein EutJ n=1 Tax=Ruminococcus gauvreauii TaxID=438033 RepID=A0ABY5VJU9_9FIRM|nr:ethanolamine utilization protein EutJ [Ruminococcus gauvreauii]UWP60469.1 ethanolamine utilization protein EutJ [Ruminococcus gauvreauii]